MQRISKILALMSAMIFLAAFAHGATITGTVKGPDGAPFKGAFVQAQNTKTKITVNVLSHKDGNYRVEDLPAGEYVLRIRAVGYQADPRTGVTLTASQSASMDWALKPGTVRWRDLSLYQGEKLIPNIRGKEMVFGPTSNFRDAPCQICHGFQTRMASVSRDLEGAKDRVDYMRTRMHFLLGSMVNDEQADKVASFIADAFGPDSALPKSPADLPEYKNLVRTFDDDAMNIVYVEYDLPGPNRMPWSAAPDKEGNVWMPYYGGANKIGKLDPETGNVKEYDVPNPNAVGIHSAYPGRGRQRVARRIWDQQDRQIRSEDGKAHGIRGRLYFPARKALSPAAASTPCESVRTELPGRVERESAASIPRQGNSRTSASRPMASRWTKTATAGSRNTTRSERSGRLTGRLWK